MTFDDFEIRAERWKTDRFAAIRGFFEDCNDNFGAALVPEDYISLDEALHPMRTQVNFKQYNPDEQAKYGLLFKSLNCARYPKVKVSKSCLLWKTSGTSRKQSLCSRNN